MTLNFSWNYYEFFMELIIPESQQKNDIEPLNKGRFISLRSFIKLKGFFSEIRTSEESPRQMRRK